MPIVEAISTCNVKFTGLKIMSASSLNGISAKATLKHSNGNVNILSF